jgi:hypothetical protein
LVAAATAAAVPSPIQRQGELVYSGTDCLPKGRAKDWLGPQTVSECAAACLHMFVHATNGDENCRCIEDGCTRPKEISKWGLSVYNSVEAAAETTAKAKTTATVTTTATTKITTVSQTTSAADTTTIEPTTAPRGPFFCNGAADNPEICVDEDLCESVDSTIAAIIHESCPGMCKGCPLSTQRVDRDDVIAHVFTKADVTCITASASFCGRDVDCCAFSAIAYVSVPIPCISGGLCVCVQGGWIKEPA